MNKTKFFIAALAVAVSAAPALAQRKKAGPKPPREIIVINTRAAVLTVFTLANAKGEVMGGLAKAVEPGKRVVLGLRKDAVCELTVTAQYDDEAENTGGQIDVCKDKTIRLTD